MAHKTQTICVLGGTGFVGSHLVRRLARDGHSIRVLTRRRERHKHLLVIPQVTLIECNVHDASVLREQFLNCNAVINLVGILNETGRATFTRAHVDLAQNVVDACVIAGVPRLLHMSALNADANETDSNYLRSRGQGEDAAHAGAERGLAVTSFRPSVIFGEGDSFFNRFVGLLRLTPMVFPLACPNARFAPVFVDDVTEAIARALDYKSTHGARIDLCGPREYTLWDLVQYAATTSGYDRYIFGLSDSLSRLQARILGIVPGKPFTLDNYYSLQKASVCKQSQWERFGITPTAVEAVVPMYLSKRRVRAHYAGWRAGARRG